jgi:anti-anti-sigma factor
MAYRCGEESPTARRVRLRGELRTVARALFNAVRASPADSPSGACLIANLAAITEVDGEGLGFLVLAHAELRERGGGLALSCCSPTVRRALEATRLIRLFDLEPPVHRGGRRDIR